MTDKLNKTGVFLTPAQFDQVTNLLAPAISMNLETNITITEPRDKRVAWELLDRIAMEAGLPKLPAGQHYGLAGDREIVSP